MARASRCGSTEEVLGLTAASIGAIMAVIEGAEPSWVEPVAGAAGAPCLWKRLIYTEVPPPCDEPVMWAEGLWVAESRLWWGWRRGAYKVSMAKAYRVKIDSRLTSR